MELIEAFDVGKHARHHFVGKHVVFAISKDHLEMKNLQCDKNNSSPFDKVRLWASQLTLT